MAHGYLLPPDGYERLMQGVAARGYTVAAPDFPHTSPKGDGNRADLVNQPAELSLVADGIIAESARPGALVPPVNRPERLAVMGHSDGGLTAAAMAYNDTYRDPRVAAVVVMSGGLALFPGGWSVPGPPPLLAIHGDADAVNPPSASTDLIAALPDNVPRYLVTVQGGDHVGPYMGETALVGLATVIADFLYVHLERNGERFADERLHADANAAPLTLTAE
jgi:dienelactone hydrolase